MTDGPILDEELAGDILRALDAEEFHLVYQPEIDLHTSGFAGVEALIRWRHPSRGVVSPLMFIPLLEANGMIVDVGRWALETACYQGAEWHARGFRFPVAVNTSVQQLRRPNFVEDVVDIVRTSRFDPTHLTLEFPYATMTDSGVQQTLTKIRAQGVRLAVDDFVPGRSSFAALTTLPLDIVKLSRTFVAETATTEQGETLIRQLVHDARDLGLRVIASGVEDEKLRDRLRDEQVDVGQGFHFARPYEVEEIDRFLEDFALFSGRPL